MPGQTPRGGKAGQMTFSFSFFWVVKGLFIVGWFGIIFGCVVSIFWVYGVFRDSFRVWFHGDFMMFWGRPWEMGWTSDSATFLKSHGNARNAPNAGRIPRAKDTGVSALFTFRPFYFGHRVTSAVMYIVFMYITPLLWSSAACNGGGADLSTRWPFWCNPSS